MKNTLLLENYLKTLRLPTFLKEYEQAARQCGQENKNYQEFLQHLAEREVATREHNAIARRLKEAGFPAEKELSEFAFTAVPKLNKKRIIYRLQQSMKSREGTKTKKGETNVE